MGSTLALSSPWKTSVRSTEAFGDPDEGATVDVLLKAFTPWVHDKLSMVLTPNFKIR
jgi:hypothetical protein